MNETKLINEMYAVANICYKRANELTWEQWAKKANLSVSTIYNLMTKQTKYPRFMTIQKLCKSVGLELSVLEDGVELRKAA